MTSGLTALAGGCTTPKTGPATAPAGIEKLLAAVTDQDGKAVGPNDLLGHWTVLWFYPKAQTGG